MRGLLAALLLAAPARAEVDHAALMRWAAELRPEAVAAGIDPVLFDEAVRALSPRPDVVAADRRQIEFTRTVGDYVTRALSEDRIEGGRRALERFGPLLARIEAEYGVQAEILAAIWGLESAYGAVRGDIPVLDALATLAAEGRRGAFFSGQFLDALALLQSGEARRADLRGSWAGAMGHMQFLPSTFRRHAVDGDGDGDRNIWEDDPADALASAAAFLRHHGWVPGQPWGIEVRLPEGFDWALARDTNRQPVAVWAALGLRRADGGALPDHGPAVVLLPMGASGPAFLTFRNFTVLEAYNTADAYVIAVGHLADRLRGGPPISAPWPQDAALSLEERLELQRLLRDRGFDPRAIDGRIGPLTVAALRRWQGAQGLIADGYPSPAMLALLREGG